MSEKFKVLIIDDSKFIIRSFEQYTERLTSVELNSTQKGKQATELASGFAPNLIFLDYILEDTDGLSVLKELKAHPTVREIPVVMISSKENTYDKELAILHGAETFLQKPLKGSQIRDMIMSFATELKQQAS